MASSIPAPPAVAAPSIIELYREVRARTMQIVAPLEIEDYVIQTAEYMSPPRWHIGHTSWFFETLLRTYQAGYQTYSEEFLFYFNSYYEGFGARIERPKRGTKSRPTVKATVAYRNHIDEQMLQFLDTIEGHSNSETILSLARLGLEHEMQHQELLVYDIKHLLCDQFAAPIQAAPRETVKVDGMAEIEGGLFWLGYSTRSSSPPSLRGSSPTVREGVDHEKSRDSKNYDFAFDNEKPAHQVFLQDYALDRRLVTNGEYLEFMRDNGYQDFRWWFSEGWEVVNRDHWLGPMYWEFHDGAWMIRDFTGLHPASEKANEPVSHVSFHEASAFAKWAGKRLPTEAEWEKAATHDPGTDGRLAFPWGNDKPDSSKANLFENGLWAPAATGSFPAGESKYNCHQMIADLWEWTTSDYVP